MDLKPIASWRENNQNKIKSKGKKGEVGLFQRHFFRDSKTKTMCDEHFKTL